MISREKREPSPDEWRLERPVCVRHGEERDERLARAVERSLAYWERAVGILPKTVGR